MKYVKLARCLIALLMLSIAAPAAWSEETAPPATTEMSNEGVPPVPAADPGFGAGSPQEAPAASEPPAERPMKKKKKKAHKAAKKSAKKKAGKHSKKKSAKKTAKKKKKKHHY